MYYRRQLALVLCLVLSSIGRPSAAQENLLTNPEFAGTGGVVIGDVLQNSPVPDNWRAFAVGGGQLVHEVVPLEESEVFDGSPPVNAVCISITAFGQDQGFDHDIADGHFPLIPGVEYHAEFWVKTANRDGSDQEFNFIFPLFSDTFLGRDPGGLRGVVATDEWQQVVAPVFQDAEATNGYIRWATVDDGGDENAICFAFPTVVQDTVGNLPPSELFCRRDLANAVLTWQNNGAYDSLRIERNGEIVAELPPGTTSYTDEDAPSQVNVYRVVAIAAGLEDGPSCELNLVQVPVGTTVSVDLGEIDIARGLENTQTAPNTDGENEFVICGPDGDVREARANFASDGPNANPDNYVYFNVVDPDMKAQQAFILTATVYDDPDIAGVGLVPQYTNSRATGPNNIENTFFPLGGGPVQFLTGTDEWIELSWQIPDAGFRSFQQGTSDFRIHITDTVSRVCFDRVDLTFLPFPGNFTCQRSATGVELSWSNPVEYDAITLLRDGDEIATLGGGVRSFHDEDVGDGDHEYELVVTVDDFETSVFCSITVFVVPNGTSVFVDLGLDDEEQGLTNSQRFENTDGENEFMDCGPDDDIREARWNLADTDNDHPDNYFYFSATDQAMKSQVQFELRATVFDAEDLAGVGLFLQYTNSASTGASDIPNTFFPLAGPPVRTLEGSGGWVELVWEIPDAGFRDFQQGTSDFRIGLTESRQVCVDTVELVFTGGGVSAPVFHRGDVNGDGTINITDGVAKLGYLFGGDTAPPTCLDAADTNDDGSLTITGAVYIFNWLFGSGRDIPDPGPTDEPCGPDPTEDELVDADCIYEACQ